MRSKTVKKQSGFLFVEAAFVFTIFLVLLMGVASYSFFVRDDNQIEAALQKAAQIVSDPNLQLTYKRLAVQRSYIAQEGFDQCRGRATPEESLSCIRQAIADGRLAVSIDPKLRERIVAGESIFTGQDIEIPPENLHPLPFSLLERPQVNGYFPVQTLPIIGIERGCFEPLNETDADIAPPLNGMNKRYYGNPYQSAGADPDPALCLHTKPMYWHSPQRADFDGDLKEDLVFFKPQGDSSRWGWKDNKGDTDLSNDEVLPPEQMDFLVYLSGAAYSHAQELRTFNLSTARSGDAPPPIPVVADYDRDGKSDYAVFEPVTGRLRIAFSSRRYNVVLEADLGAVGKDSTGKRGLIAIPGTYEDTAKMQLAVFATGGESAERFKIYLTDKEAINTALASAAPFPQNVTTITTTLNLSVAPHNMRSEDAASTVPYYATSAVPAFGDYDDDGITEAGWLSWNGGNLAKRVAGYVPPPNEAPRNPQARLTMPDIPAIISAALEIRVSPFDLQLDSHGNLYTLDAVDSRLWKFRLESVSQGTLRLVSGNGILMPAVDSQRNFSADDFPASNVLNVNNPQQESALVEPHTNLAAADRHLKNPRKLVYAPDGAMYVSDWGNGRIIRLAAGGENGIESSATLTRVVLGDANCAAGGITCSDLPNNLAPSAKDWNQGVQVASLLGDLPWGGAPFGATIFGAPPFTQPFMLPPIFAKSAPPEPLPTEIPDPEFSPVPWGTPTPVPSASGGKFNMFPIALEVVPDYPTAGKYSLAFSSGAAVYLIVPKSNGSEGGPVGEAGEMIYRIAGAGAGNAGDGVPVPAGGVHDKRYFNSDSGALPQGTAICPISDLKFSTAHDRFYAASSCSLLMAPSGTPQPTKNVGGILEILPATGGNFLSQANQLRSVVGGFWEKPCRGAFLGDNRKCSGPSISGAGIYQRKIDIAASSSTLAAIDMINPVDLEWGPDNTLLFIDQWNAASEADLNKYRYSPNRTDHQHQQGIYAVKLNSMSGSAEQIIPITNPLSYGSGTVPVESAHWRSPYQSGQSEPQLDIPAHEAPVKNIPFPATAGLAVDEANGILYASTPWMQNPGSYGCNDSGGMGPPPTPTPPPGAPHPYCTNPDNVGFVYQIKLDFDGDGVQDMQDGDIRGFAPSTSDPDAVKKKIGQPVQTFFKLGQDALVKLPGNATAAKADYFFFNSVSECGSDNASRPENNCQDGTFSGRVVRQEPWATLLNFGDDQDFEAYDKVCNSSSAVGEQGPYFGCDFTSNGPIAAPAPLHTFVGSAGEAGQGFYQATSPDAPAYSGLFLYPVVLSSTMPKENGVKPVRGKISDSSVKEVRNYESGVICNQYNLVKYTGGTHIAPAVDLTASPFKANLSNFLSVYSGSSFTNEEDFNISESPAQKDSDSFNYFATCTASGGTEAVILQLDHDDTPEKENPNPDPANGAVHFPSPFVTGPRSDPENTRQFLLLDTDGDGVPNPSWLSSEAILSSTTRDFKTGGPLTFISTRLLPSAKIDSYMEAARSPFTIDGILNSLQLTEVGTSYRKPVYFGDTGASATYSFDKSADTAKEAIFLGLDFEPYVARTLKVDWKHESEQSGASGYANYVKDNRYNMVEYPGTTANELPESPGMVAAEKFISQAMNIPLDKITNQESKFDSGSADLLLDFVAFDAEGKAVACNEELGTRDLSKRCTHLRALSRFTKGSIWRGLKLKDVVTRYAKLSDAPHMHRVCDPNPNPPYPCPGEPQA